MDIKEKNTAKILYVVKFLPAAALVILAPKTVLPFAFAFFISFAVTGLSGRLKKVTGLRQKMLSVILLLVFFLALVILIYLFGRFAFEKILRLARNLPQIYTDVIEPFALLLEEKMSGIKNGEFGEVFELIFTSLRKSLNNRVASVSGKAVEWTAKFALKLPGFFFFFLITAVSSFFICLDFDNIMKYISRHLSSKTSQTLAKIREITFNSIFRLIFCEFILFLITFVELFLGLKLLSVKNVALLSFVIAILDILPVLGVGTFLLPWAVFVYLSGNFPLALGLVALFLIVSVVKSILEPKIIGKNIGIHPLISLISVYIGVKLFGFGGAFVMPLIVVVVKCLNDGKVIKLYNK